jgi:hypothetical protein
MLFQEMMDSIIKARADILHAGRLLAQLDLGAGKSPEPNEYSLLKSLIEQANEVLDSVVSCMVKESTRMNDAEDSAPPRLRRRAAPHRSRLS